VRTDHFSKLTCLDLTYKKVSAEKGMQLAQSPYMANLRSVKLSCNEIEDDSTSLIAKSSYFGNLTKLIDYNDQGIMELAR